MTTYPYFIYPDVMALRSGHLTDSERRVATARIIANVGDPAALRIILGMDPEEFAAFYPDMTTSTPSTSDTIDAFIDKFGKNSEAAVPSPVIAEILEEECGHFFPKSENTDEESIIVDDESLSEKGSNPETNNKQEVINNKQEVLNTEEEGNHFSPKSENSQEETVADLIKNRRYQEAIERLTALNLNNPKKSVYFAHQISFLKKLIDNEARKAKNLERNQK